jgi:L-2,4-diaminobutyrate transaminase
MPHGDILGLAPPLITTLDDIHEIAAIVGRSVSAVSDELARDGVI